MKTVIIELDRPRRLRFDVNALADIEEKAGMGFGKIMEQELSLALLRLLLWAGLKWEDRKLTVERCGVLIQQYVEQGGDIETLGTKVSEAVMTCGLFKDEGEDNPNNVEEAGAN